MERYEELKNKLINVGDTGTMQCFGESMVPLIKSGSVLTFRKEENYQKGDIVFCQITADMTYERKVRWFIRTHLEPMGVVLEEVFPSMLEELKEENLDNFTYNGKQYTVPNQITFYVDAHMVINVKEGKYLIGAVNTQYGINGWADEVYGRVIEARCEDLEDFYNESRVYGDAVAKAYGI
jgi:ABC-type glycerol-3-phosphate transport system substrate-binding protein